MDFENLQFRVDGGVASIVLNRPDAANALNIPMAQELMRAIIRCDRDPEIRAVLLTGSGSMFCAGGDLRSFSSAGDQLPSLIRELTVYLHASISRMASMNPPVVAAVQGAAAGAGMSLACSADFAVAADSARFTVAYTQVGLVPDGSATYVLPRLIGLRRAEELMLTNRVLSATEALEWGLISRVVPDEELVSESEKLATSLAAGPTRAFGAVKRLLLTTFSNGLESQMEQESREIADAAGRADAKEGIAAFLKKRKPEFVGR
jgi:2-(1,2-epoxy-1,2-dihydrophenyl)acetyl-CoA isomerase